MIVSDFITNNVRGQISDTLAEYRFSDPVLLAYINAGRREIKRSHPVAFCGSSVVVGEISDLALTDSLDIIAGYMESLSHYVCHKVFSEDSEDAGNAKLAIFHYELYRKVLD